MQKDEKEEHRRAWFGGVLTGWCYFAPFIEISLKQAQLPLAVSCSLH